MPIETAPVRVSVKSLLQKFHPCTPEYITTVCRGRCCEGTGGISVTVHGAERDRIVAMGCSVTNGLIDADRRGLCPFKMDVGFCRIHIVGKPFGCCASPFTLTPHDTVIVRNRYRLLRCYRRDGCLPAYIAHRWSLDQIFGIREAARLVGEIESGKNDLCAEMPAENYRAMKENTRIRKEAACPTITKETGSFQTATFRKS